VVEMTQKRAKKRKKRKKRKVGLGDIREERVASRE
jgi:hypothetical protein